MKLRAERDDLKRALDVVTKHAGAHLPATHGVRIEVGRTINVSCTDIDVLCTADIDGAALDKGVAIPPAKILAGVIGNLAPGSVELTLEVGNLTISNRTDTHTLRTLETTEWPRIAPADGTAHVLTVDQCRTIERTLPAANTDRDRSAILCNAHLGGTRVECTDSYRLHLAELDGADLPDLLIPAPALARALATVDDSGLTINVDDDGRRITLTTTAASWTLVCSPGEFPKTDGLVDPSRKSLCHHLTVDRDGMLAALKRLHPLASIETATGTGRDASKSTAPLRLTVDGGTLTIATSVQNVGSGAVTVEASGEVPEGGMAFNAHYLVGALQACTVDEVTIASTDSLKPVLIDNGGLTVLVMPVRVA